MNLPARLPVRITLVVENSVRERGLVAEHGLGWWLEWGERTILFDCGQGLALEGNARQLGLELAGVQDLVLSHGHYDHAGGLATLVARGARPRVLAHPFALAERYARRGEASREIGLPTDARSQLLGGGLELAATVEPTEIAPGLFATGEIPRQAWEQEGGPLYLDRAGRQADPVVDDQALFFRTTEGLVVLLGCAHAGVVGTLAHVQALAGEERLRLVAGGMHLESASPPRLQRTLEALAALPLSRLAPLHCTGLAARCLLRTFLPERYLDAAVGSRWSFEALTGGLREPGEEGARR